MTAQRHNHRAPEEEQKITPGRPCDTDARPSKKMYAFFRGRRAPPLPARARLRSTKSQRGVHSPHLEHNLFDGFPLKSRRLRCLGGNTPAFSSEKGGNEQERGEMIVKGRVEWGGDILIVMHGRSRMTIDPSIPTMPGRSMSGFHRSCRHGRYQVRSAARCSASRMKGEPHPAKKRL